MKLAAKLVLVVACGGLAAWAPAQMPGLRSRGRGGGAAVGRNFSLHGALEVVTHDAVGVRGGDGSIYWALLPSQGPLRPQALTAAYRVGDEVDFEAEFMAPRFVAADQQSYQLELRQLKLRKHGSGGGLRDALSSPAWRVANNLLPRPAGAATAARPVTRPPADDAFLAATRRAVLNYVAQLPNFLVTESVTRRSGAFYRARTDRIDSELAVVKGREQRSHITVNGAAWKRTFAEVPGLHWNADFADRLYPIFQPLCGAVFKADGHGQRDGQAVAVYDFRLAPSLCAGYVQAGPAWAYPGLQGKLYISTRSHLVVRLEQHYTQLPGAFEESASQDATDWAPVTVAGKQWLMPARAQMASRFRDGRLVTISVAYKNYRRFEISSSIKVVGRPAKK